MLRSLLHPARRRGFLLVFVGVAMVLAGCGPRDPLERKVEARTLAELQGWLVEVKRSVDPELAREIDLVFVNLASQTPRFRRPANERDLHQRGNALCRRVHGRRLREVMIESYESAITTLALQNNIDADNLLRLAAVVHTDRADTFARRIDAVKAGIAERDQRIEHHRSRIAELRTASP